MSFRQKIGHWFSGDDTTNKSSSNTPFIVHLNGGQPIFTPRRYDKLSEEGYKKNVIVYRCVRLIVQNAISAPWLVYKKDKNNKRVRLMDHPLVDLLNCPNPMQSGAELFESMYSYFLISGNSYIKAIGPDIATQPQELWALRPDRMSIIAGDNAVPEAYRYSVHGHNIDFPVDKLNAKSQLLHVKSFHPLDDWYGLSPLEAAAFSIDQHNEAAKWNASLLQNSGRPSGALVYKPVDGTDTLTEEQRQNLKAELEQYYTGGANAGRPLVLEGGLDWREMSMSPKDMDWIAGKDVSAREIALAYNVPSQLIGIEGALTYANFEQARLAFYDDAVLPLLKHFKSELNKWLVPKFGEGLELDYNIDAIDALSPRRDKIWKRIKESDFMTINEKRAVVGLDPVPNGDVLKDIQHEGG